jgi:hypothetical protein
VANHQTTTGNPSNLQSAVVNRQCKASIDDIRSTARYRARIAANLLREFLTAKS